MMFLLTFFLILDLNFAKSLEMEGDYWRAIYEYKRVYYSTQDSLEKQMAASRIVYLSAIQGDYKQALLYVDRINQVDTLKNIKKGIILTLDGKFDLSKKYFEGNDTLLAWWYLKKGEVNGAKGYFPELRYKRVSPLIAGLMSAVIPGSGKVYSGRLFDGFSSFIINATTFYTFYRAYKNQRKFETYFYGGLSVIFYLGDIYGSVLSAQEENEWKLKRLISDFESKVGIWKYLK